MIEVVDGLDLSGVPVPFLEAYPFPAFVLTVAVSTRTNRPRLVSRDTDITIRQYDDISPLTGPPVRNVSASTIAWSNERWLQVTEGRPLGDILDSFVQNALQTWIEDQDDDDEEKAVFTLQLREPTSAPLYLTKTILPFTPPSTTHAFCVVTSQAPTSERTASSVSDISSPHPRSSMSSELRSNFSQFRVSGSTDRASSFALTEPSTSRHNSAADGYFPHPPASERTSSSRSRMKLRPGKDPQLSIQHMVSAADEHWQLLESFDWSKTKLGPSEHWVETIGPLLSATFQSKTMDALWLGEDLQLIYNKVYASLVDHPSSFGAPGSQVWASIWDYLGPLAETVMKGTPVYKEEDLIIYKKYDVDHDLETYFDWRYVPIATRDGKIIGLFNQATDSTGKVLAERRLGTVREMSEQLLVTRTMREYYDAIEEVLRQNPRDAPFVLCYSVAQKEKLANAVAVEAKLECSVGVPDEHSSKAPLLHFNVPVKTRMAFGPGADRLSSPTLSAISALSSGSGRQYIVSNDSSWPIQKALASRQSVIVEDCRDLVQGFPIRAWDELPFAAAVVPICSDNSTEMPEAVIIIGLNVRRPLDAEYDEWIHLLRSQLASALSSVKAHEAEQRRQEESLRMEKAKTAWFRGAAHDLRSPLTLVKGPLEDLLSTELNPGQKHQAMTAKRNVDRLLRLVNSLLDFSRLEAGRVKARFVPINLGEWVRDLAEVFRDAVERMGIRYNIDIVTHDALVCVDPSLFETVISNLIGNALKYTEQGSIEVRVRVDNHADGRAEVAISDTGFGIPKDEIQHVTDWYHRATTAVHAGTQGTGLGLALAKELVKLHEGELKVASQIKTASGGPHGSTFTVSIPITQAEQYDATSEIEVGQYGKELAKEAMRWTRGGGSASASSEGGEGDSAGGSGSMSRLTDGLLFESTDVILVVDDNSEMRQYLKSIFKRHCQVLEARDGQEALEITRARRPNLILTDFMMPRLNGLELLAEIRNNEATRLIPVILLSAMQGDEARVDALFMGAEDYIEKPFKPKELVARCHLHLQVGKKRVKLEAGFAERTAEIALLSDFCPTGIMRAGPDGVLTYANDAWRQSAGMPAEEPAANWPKYVTHETVTKLMGPWVEFLSGEQRELKLSWKWLTGSTVEGHFIRLDLFGEGLSGILGCISDITYQEQRVVEAEERRREAEESKHQQELLIDLTSHEIRTPVSAILQCSSLVKENLVALKEQLKWTGNGGFVPTKELLHDLEEDVEALESIYQCGLVQERIAGDVLSLARIQLDMLSLYDVEMDLKKEAKKILSVFAAEGKMKQIELGLKLGQSLEQAKVAEIKTDPVRLGQVVTNLISNAIRFTASSDIRKITVTYDVSFVPPADDTCALPSSIGLPDPVPPQEDTPMWLFVSVKDTGPGLGPKELAMLFKRFSQGNKMIHTRYGGSGLGLFICRKITELLGGRIEVQSQLGEGSTFRFFVKTRAVAPKSAIAAMVDATSSALRPELSRDNSLQSAQSGAMTPALSVSSNQSMGSYADNDWSDHHILIVEDNIINQTVLKRQLVKAGLTCDVANNGLEALNLIRETDRQARRGGAGRKKRYNVVLMDLEMPVMDGLTAVREIRAAEAAGTLARNMIVALTGNARQGQIDQAMAAGMDDVVIKPYVLKNLLQKIRAMGVKKAEIEAALEL